MDVYEKLEELAEIILRDKGDIFIIVFIFLAFTVYCIQAVYVSSIEEIFMEEKNKFKNVVCKLIFLWVILIPKNLFLGMYDVYILFGIVICSFLYIRYLLYRNQENKIKNDSKVRCELKKYYEDKQSELFLKLVMYCMPILPILVRVMRQDVSMFMLAIITSVLEVAILCISAPEFIIKKSMDYYLDGKDKIYLYKSLQNNNFLCGDSENISQASKYTIMSLEDLKMKEILHQKYNKLTKMERKALCKEMKNKGEV